MIISPEYNIIDPVGSFSSKTCHNKYAIKGIDC